jgi:hypothetical protein
MYASFLCRESRTIETFPAFRREELPTLTARAQLELRLATKVPQPGNIKTLVSGNIFRYLSSGLLPVCNLLL